ncbi:hypothetical protein VNO78_08020 [Psophocarpus tetragonolobus]|uniref:RRM domain-containing protein n=1 Tax=Psophocarpus tetragonolobus TaxID=3891 RepID=A0AAN9SWG0_PSOTE
MEQIFALWEVVTNVFIPNKGNQFQKHFGFVTYDHVKDMEALAKSLDSIWIGTFKLKANLHHFQRGGEWIIRSKGLRHEGYESPKAEKKGLDLKPIIEVSKQVVPKLSMKVWRIKKPQAMDPSAAEERKGLSYLVEELEDGSLEMDVGGLMPGVAERVAAAMTLCVANSEVSSACKEVTILMIMHTVESVDIVGFVNHVADHVPAFEAPHVANPEGPSVCKETAISLITLELEMVVEVEVGYPRRVKNYGERLEGLEVDR